MDSTMSWREARQVLQDAGCGVNEAQQILDDLAHFTERRHSYRVPVGTTGRWDVKWLRYAGLDGQKQPRYAADLYQAGRPPAPR